MRFARQTNRSVSPTTTSPDSLFCSTCLKNQNLLAVNLAEYLPDSSDPRYHTFELKYPEYKKNLEKRYPPVCHNCEPKVRARIRDTGYAAKTDHLRRMMEATRGNAAARHQTVWQYVLVRVGAFCWWLALAGQLLWNGLGALALAFADAGLRDDETSLWNTPELDSASLLQYIQNAGRVGAGYADYARPVGKIALILSFCSIWWCPSMLKGTIARSRGLAEYYKLQVIIIMLRLVAWYALSGITETAMPQAMKAIHAGMVAFNIVV